MRLANVLIQNPCNRMTYSDTRKNSRYFGKYCVTGHFESTSLPNRKSSFTHLCGRGEKSVVTSRVATFAHNSITNLCRQQWEKLFDPTSL